MATARRDLLDLADPGWVHCTNRCVRRAWLCGVDPYDRRSYEHRKSWVEHRLRRAAKAFCVDVAGYSVMDNHIHLVVRMRPDAVDDLDAAAVIDRWLMVYPGFRETAPRSGADPTLSPDPKQGQREKLLADPGAIATCRERLGDISWFMSTITEPIARWANAEDGVTGRFWEGRFRTHPILDLPALLATMTYVDLNPIRAGITDLPETSDYTSGQRRLRALAVVVCDTGKEPERVAATDMASRLDWLLPIAELTAWDAEEGVGGWREVDYLRLLESTGRCLASGKHGRIDPSLPGLLERLQVSIGSWQADMARPGAMRGTLGSQTCRDTEATRRRRRYTRTCCRLFDRKTACAQVLACS